MSEPHSNQPNLTSVVSHIEDALSDLKAKDVLVLNVEGLTDVTDRVVIATGTSKRHVKACADKVAERMRELSFKPIGTEGETEGEWVLVDFGFAVVHLMLEQTRKFYDLEKLWSDFPEEATQSA